MATILEQALADYLNWYPDRIENEQLLRSLMVDKVEFTMGTGQYTGIDSVMKKLGETSDAIASDYGFVARPVIAKEFDSENPEQFACRKAVALFSKLEEYISWIYFIEINPDNFKIANLRAIMGSKYQHPLYYDLYELKQSCKK